ncbi:MAG: alpha/beta hydrolase [Chloroflexota bacterium]
MDPDPGWEPAAWTTTSIGVAKMALPDRGTLGTGAPSGSPPRRPAFHGRPARKALVFVALFGGGCVVLVCGVLAILGWVASDRVLHPSAMSSAGLISPYRSLSSESVTFHGATGTILSGRFFPGRLHAAIVLSHGYGATQEQMLPRASFLHQAGFSVFTYDMRGSGKSGGSITFGALEQQDLIAAVDYLVSRPDVDKGKIAALGFSMGGAVSIMAAARDTRIKAVVDDSGYAELDHWFSDSVGEFLRHPTDPYSLLSLKMVEWRIGINADNLRPAAKIALISPRPVFIIQGTADHDLSPRNSIENYAAAKQPKELWLVQGAGHGQTLQRAGSAYVRRVVAFFRKALHP